jgi:uncharacterized protein YjbI with pentapeptide repeats
MKPMIGISAMALLAAGGWGMGARARPPAPAARLEPAVLREEPGGRGDRSPEGGVRLAAAEDRIDLRADEFEAKASEEWTLPRDGASSLQLRSQGAHIRSGIRLAPAEGDQLQIRVVKQARAESETEARALLAEVQVERRRDGDAWVVAASWPQKRRVHRVGRNTYSDEDSRKVTFEIRLPRGMRLDLTRLNLIGADLVGQDLREVNLAGLTMIGADLTEANLTGNNLSGTHLVGANLSRARLAHANLANADLTGARLAGTDLAEVDLTKASLTGVDLTGVDLTRVKLAGLSLVGANLSHANLAGKDMSGANLVGANLTGANLAHADLTRANLVGARLRDADITGAKLDGANRIGADLPDSLRRRHSERDRGAGE